MEQQVDKSHYDFNRYCYPDRWASYYYQIRESLALHPKNILEVGVGDGVFRDYVRAHSDVEYKNIDIAADLHPDILGSVEHIPLGDNSYDLVCAFEILEHLPFEKFEIAVGEMARVAQKNVLISLPHFGPPVKFNVKIPFLPEIKFAFKIPFPKKHIFNGEHYWEIGKRGFPTKRIEEVLAKFGKVKKDFVPYENQYHHFFVVELN